MGAFSLFWSGFNYNATDIMFELANLNASQTASSIYVTFSIVNGLSAFITG